MKNKLTEKSIFAFQKWLIAEEKSENTIEKYTRDLAAFSRYLDGKLITKESVSSWKECLINEGFKPSTVNSMLASVNTYCRFAGLPVKIKFLRLQRRLFCDENRELKKDEYERLIFAAQACGKARLALMIETIGATGIRVSELQYVTVEAARNGKAEISLKGKIRTILIPGKLCKKLLHYAQKQKIAFGEIFVTKSGKGLTRKQIWSEMKTISAKAGVNPSKVFPHNLRHLFARVFYKVTRDVVKLADILGHSSVETTRIYLISTCAEHRKQLEMLRLVLV